MCCKAKLFRLSTGTSKLIEYEDEEDLCYPEFSEKTEISYNALEGLILANTIKLLGLVNLRRVTILVDTK